MSIYHHKESAMIRGVTYKYGQAFTCASAQSGSGDSQGNGTAMALEKGTTYYYYGYATGDDGGLTAYPYLIYVNSSTVRGWFKEDVFPYATFKVTFNPNGGTLKNPGGNLNNGTNTNSVTVVYSKSSYSSMSSDIPTRTGYKFKGWYTSPSGGTKVYNASGKATNEGTYWNSNCWFYIGNVTLYAQWTANTYSVTFNANGGSGAPGTQTKTHDKDLTLSNTKPTRSGYTFVNWNTRSDGSGTAYSSGGTFKANGNTTLYAVWIANTYSVTFNANGGSGAPETQTKTHDKDLTLSVTIPTRTGYVFLRWNTKADGSGTNYAPGSIYNANAGITLYAIWQIIVYTISYDANGGSGAPGAQSKNHGDTVTLSAQIPIRKNYKFLYWSTQENGMGTTYYPGASLATNASGVDGYTPVKGVDYYTDADQEDIVQQVITALGTPVFGRVDDNNVITLSGELTDGIYTIQYEDADGKHITIGTLTNKEVTYTNALALATDENGEVWNGVGYADGYRLQSYAGTTGSNSMAATEGYFVTGLIPYTLEQAKNQVPFYVKGIDLDLTSLPQYLRYSMVVLGNTDWYGTVTIDDMTDIGKMAITQLGNDYYRFTPNQNFFAGNGWDKKDPTPTHIRFSMPGSGAGVIITINEPIE